MPKLRLFVLLLLACQICFPALVDAKPHKHHKSVVHHKHHHTKHAHATHTVHTAKALKTPSVSLPLAAPAPAN